MGLLSTSGGQKIYLCPPPRLSLGLSLPGRSTSSLFLMTSHCADSCTADFVCQKARLFFLFLVSLQRENFDFASIVCPLKALEHFGRHSLKVSEISAAFKDLTEVCGTRLQINPSAAFSSKFSNLSTSWWAAFTPLHRCIQMSYRVSR